MMGTQLSERYRVSSNCTRGSSIGTVEGKISGLRSPFSQRLWITAAIRRSTPRVRWNFTSVDQSV
jgi:hypothetical protein